MYKSLNILSVILFYNLFHGDKENIITQQIIVHPFSCVNISLNHEISDEIISVTLVGENNRFKALVWANDFSLELIDYFFTRYFHNIGDNWVSICDIDNIINNLHLRFKVNKNNFFYLYDTRPIKLANCKYISGCQHNLFPNDNKIIPRYTHLTVDTKNYKIKINLDSQIIQQKFLFFSICAPGVDCYHHAITNHDETLNFYENNLNFNSLALEINVINVNRKLSQSTLHLLYEENGKNYILTSYVIIHHKALKYKQINNNVSYYLRKNVEISSFYVTILDDDMKELTYEENNMSNFAKKKYFNGFIFERNYIYWESILDKKFSIIFMVFDLYIEDIEFIETLYLFFENFKDYNEIKSTRNQYNINVNIDGSSYKNVIEYGESVFRSEGNGSSGRYLIIAIIFIVVILAVLPLILIKFFWSKIQTVNLSTYYIKQENAQFKTINISKKTCDK